MTQEELNKKAEEAAREVYTYTFQGMDDLIGLFLAGYKLAEKDLALTWEDVQLLDHFVLELVREEKEGKDWGDGKEFYTEVLTRFKRFKEGKK